MVLHYFYLEYEEKTRDKSWVKFQVKKRKMKGTVTKGVHKAKTKQKLT